MPIFYPPIDLEAELSSSEEINYAEHEVLKALDAGLDEKWHVFHRFQWREVNRQGERIGEADMIIFHPNYGILVIEVKGGGIRTENGDWFQTNLRAGVEHKLAMPPFQQARRSLYHLSDKLKGTTLGQDFEKTFAFTHTAWFPDITWTAPIPPEIPNGAYILDSRHLMNPSQHIRNILRQSNPHTKPWDDRDTGIFLRTLAPTFNLLVPLGVQLSRIRSRLLRMTEEQLLVSNSLRERKRLLVEGCAGSGKTLLAVALARDHIASGKRVLFTCYNKRLAEAVLGDLKGEAAIDVVHFHEMARILCEEAGIPYKVPVDMEARKDFFENTCPELMLDCASKTKRRYDTIIVDEAFDFHETWWMALESLGKDGFSYYAFYDQNQNVFTEKAAWKPPFPADPLPLFKNVRNARPIGRFASKIGNVPEAAAYGVKDGPEPELIPYADVAEIPAILGKLIADLTGKNKVAVDDIIILSPYKPDHERLGLGKFLKERNYSATPKSVFCAPYTVIPDCLYRGSGFAVFDKPYSRLRPRE